MKSVQIVSALAALAASASALVTRDGRFACSVEATDEFKAASAQMAIQEASNATFRAEAKAATITVQTYFHNVACSQTLADGYIPESQLTAQLQVMNTDFAPHGIQFVLAGTTRTINTAWCNDGNELAMKKSLRKGDYKTVNIYFLKSIGGAFGYAYLPASVTSTTSTAFYRDGVSILYSTVPGGSSTNFNEGKTVTHEVGHWLGLLHTFDGNSCSGSGDSVADTPQQLSATSGCPTGRDSCPNVAGLDPINNYMDYSYDSCYEEFTAGQETRMINSWNTYRA